MKFIHKQPQNRVPVISLIAILEVHGIQIVLLPDVPTVKTSFSGMPAAASWDNGPEAQGLIWRNKYN